MERAIVGIAEKFLVKPIGRVFYPPDSRAPVAPFSTKKFEGLMI
jgi:hypothetical protein